MGRRAGSVRCGMGVEPTVSSDHDLVQSVLTRCIGGIIRVRRCMTG